MELLPRIVLTAFPFLDAMIILAVSLAGAVFVDLIVVRVVRRLVASTATDLDDRVISLLHRPIFLTVLLFGGALALRRIGVDQAWNRVLQTVLIFVWAVALIRVTSLLSGHLHRFVSGESNAGQNLGSLFKNVTAILIVISAAMAVLSAWQVSITPLLASAGIAGAAVAFASKDTIANFLGGISVLVDRPYSLGHYIVLESGERGEVVDIGLRSTRIKTRDDILISVPNSIMANSKIVNESAPVKKFRVRIPVGVAYGSDLKKVEALLVGVAGDNPSVEEEPPPRVRFRAFGDSSLNIELLCWTGDPENRGRVVHELNLAVYERFGAEGIVIPFPQRDVHLHNR